MQTVFIAKSVYCRSYLVGVAGVRPAGCSVTRCTVRRDPAEMDPISVDTDHR